MSLGEREREEQTRENKRRGAATYKKALSRSERDASVEERKISAFTTTVEEEEEASRLMESLPLS